MSVAVGAAAQVCVTAGVGGVGALVAVSMAGGAAMPDTTGVGACPEERVTANHPKGLQAMIVKRLSSITSAQNRSSDFMRFSISSWTLVPFSRNGCDICRVPL